MTITNQNLILVIEECGEVIQACTKILRFGVDDTYDGVSNRAALTQEVGDLVACLDRLGLDHDEVRTAMKNKAVKLLIWAPD